MVGRLLVVYFLRRGRWQAAILAPLLFVMLWIAGEGNLMPSAFFLSAGFALTLGPQTMRFVPLALWYLPVSHRDVWRASWLAATVGVVAMTTAVKLLAMLVLPHGPDVSAVTITGAYDFAATGVGCGLVIVSTHAPWIRMPWRYLSSSSRHAADLVTPLAFPTVLLAQSLGWHLPLRWSDLSATDGAILATLLAVTIATYFHRPVPPTPATRLAGSARARNPQVALDRGGLSGLPRLLAREYGLFLLIGLGMSAVSTVVVLVITGLLHSPQELRTLLRDELLLIDRPNDSPMAEGSRMLAFMIWYGFFGATVAARLPSMTRHLRVLPLSTSQLQALLVGWPAIAWITVWTAVLLVRYAVIGTLPASQLLAPLLGTVGLSALMRALSLRLAARPRLFFSVIVGVVPLLQAFSPSSTATVATVGLGMLAGAMLITRDALRRNSTYKNGPTILGMPIVQAPR